MATDEVIFACDTCRPYVAVTFTEPDADGARDAVCPKCTKSWRFVPYKGGYVLEQIAKAMQQAQGA